jgi:hypothetical protein
MLYCGPSVCQLAESGVSFIIGPPDIHIGTVIEALCEELHVIYIKYYWDVPREPVRTAGFSISVFPVQLYLDMTKELLLYWQWKQVVLIYRQDISEQLQLFHAKYDGKQSWVPLVACPTYCEVAALHI